VASQQDTQVIMNSGNVFADLGVSEPEEELAKAQLASHIRLTIKHRRLSQAAAAALMGVDQVNVSSLMKGRLSGLSSEQLLRYLTRLMQDVVRSSAGV